MEITPGIKAKPIVTDGEEVAEIRSVIAAQQISQEEQTKGRVKAILEDVRNRLQAMQGPIVITEEMEQLGIAKQVWSMIQQAEVALPLRRALSRLEDDFEDDLDDPRSWID